MVKKYFVSGFMAEDIKGISSILDENCFSANTWLPWVNGTVNLNRLLETESNLYIRSERFLTENEKCYGVTIKGFSAVQHKLLPIHKIDHTFCENFLFESSYDDIILISSDISHETGCSRESSVFIYKVSENYSLTKSFVVPELVKQISVGHAHAIALADNGKSLFTWGCNTRGELGTSSNKVNSEKFELVEQLNGMNWAMVGNKLKIFLLVSSYSSKVC